MWYNGWVDRIRFVKARNTKKYEMHINDTFIYGWYVYYSHLFANITTYPAKRWCLITPLFDVSLDKYVLVEDLGLAKYDLINLWYSFPEEERIRFAAHKG